MKRVFNSATRAAMGATLLLATFCSPIANAAGKPIPASRPESGPGFNMSDWLRVVSAIDFDTWNRNHPGPHGGWFSPDSDECAKKYEITWGPLGIRTLMHDHTWGTLPAFRRAWPIRLLDADSNLIFDCFEVIAVIPGSPADGHLEKGDLLVAMDGSFFKTSGALRPTRAMWKHQDSRSLEMDAGERLDIAEGRGRVSFDVIRANQNSPSAAPLAAGSVLKDLSISDELPRTPRHEVELDVPVSTGQELSILLELTHDGNGSCGADLIRPRLEGSAGTLDLSDQRRLSQGTGWGAVRRGGATYQKQEIEESLWFHAPGHFTWQVPPGYNRFKAKLVSHPSAAGFKARMTARTAPRAIPDSLASMHRVVSFNIPKIGRYANGFPNNNDPKSALVAKMTAAWLASQQQEDGSWKRNVGYTHRGYDTAWVGLGLLAQGDKAYDSHVRKAAEFIAFDCRQDGWAVPNAVMIMFLSEYWLRTADDRVLIPLQSLVEKVRSEMVYGDWNGGHGLNPGYGGSGVSTGGSHISLAFALANLTPAKPEPGIVDKMLARAQELAPDGFVPYGRGTGTREFVPNLEGAGTYSGRHGPYLVASMIHGGPRLFTENCREMYAKGPPGGIDQGHATQTLSTSWALIAAAICDPKILERHMGALRWKFTMMRCFEGGFGWNAYRLEYQGGEGLLPAYLRSGAYLVAFNAHKKNLAMTGNTKWRAKSFPDLPPVCHNDAVALGYYQRNWGVAEAVLGNEAPASLRSGLKSLLAMGKGAETRTELYQFLKSTAAPTARDILKSEALDSLTRQYLAEMVMGVDLRLSVELERTENKPVAGKWKVTLDAQHPLSGWMVAADKAEQESWRKTPPLPMQGSVAIMDASGKLFGGAKIPLASDFGNNGWHVKSTSSLVAGPPAGPLPLLAHIQYRVGDLSFDYERPITADGLEPGNGEKGRKVLGDRVVWVKGRLDQDLNGWNASFTLPSRQFVSAATQGVASRVNRRHEAWVSPQDGTVPAGTQCEFGFCSGWQYFEARVSAIRLLNPLDEVLPKSISVGKSALEFEPLMDHDRGTAQVADIGEIMVELPAPEMIRAIDLRLKGNGKGLRMKVFANTAGESKLVFLGRPCERSSAFKPVETRSLKIVLEPVDGKAGQYSLEELRIFRVLK